MKGAIRKSASAVERAVERDSGIPLHIRKMISMMILGRAQGIAGKVDTHALPVMLSKQKGKRRTTFLFLDFMK